jgi:hypothetical protein
MTIVAAAPKSVHSPEPIFIFYSFIEIKNSTRDPRSSFGILLGGSGPGIR